MIRRGLMIAATGLATVALMAGCPQRTQYAECREEVQRLNTIIINYEKENRDLMAQIEQAEMQRRKAELAASAAERKIAALKNGMTNLRSAVRLETKVQQQLEILAERLGGTLIDNRLQLPSDLFFGSGEYKLRENSKDAIRQLAAILGGENLMLMVVGHTDDDPIKALKRKGIETNRELSLMRSLAVLDALKDNGYPEDLMYPTGWGELKPVASNGVKEGKARNRRVEIYIDPAASGLFSNVAITDVQPPMGIEGTGGPVEILDAPLGEAD